MENGLKSEQRGALLELTIDRPKANAIDNGLSRALGEAFIRYRDDAELRCCIIGAAGDKFFSAGWDLKAAAEAGQGGENYGLGGFAGLTELFDLDKPVIAAVNGLAVGGGFELALSADLIIAAEHAAFFLPEAQIGLMPDAGGIFRLPRRLPEAIALEVLLTGRRLSAAEALQFGLVNQVVPLADLWDAARNMAARILGSAPLAAMAIKQTHRLTRQLDLPAAYAALRGGQVPAYDRLRQSDDYYEGARAFAEKRKPVWKGA
ncbi:MAG: enoyl-CoA hydratase-related protein [Dongiaceae bacterium]